MGVRCCRWMVSVVVVIGVTCGWILVDLGEEKDENEPQNFVVRFVTHWWDIRPPPHLFRLLHHCVAPSSSSSSSSSSRPSPYPSSVSPLLLFLIVVSSCRRRCCFSPYCCLSIPHLLPSPHSPLSKTNLPTSLWRGEGRIGLQPRL